MASGQHDNVMVLVDSMPLFCSVRWLLSRSNGALRFEEHLRELTSLEDQPEECLDLVKEELVKVLREANRSQLVGFYTNSLLVGYYFANSVNDIVSTSISEGYGDPKDI